MGSPVPTPSPPPQTNPDPAAVVAPEHRLSTVDGLSLLVGTVVGFGIFSLPPGVAAAVDTPGQFLGLWLLGGAVAAIGALCYAELAGVDADSSGEYGFLRRAWGERVGFLFVWARLTVIQTGAIALVALIYGDHAQMLVPLGPLGPSIHAASAIVLLTVFNMRGAAIGAGVQKGLTVALILLMVALATASLMLEPKHIPATDTAPDGGGALGLALIFVLLTYSGWNEAAYVAGELRDARRGMLKVLVLGVAVVTGLYLALNLAYLQVLGLGGLAASKTPAVDLAGAALGDGAATATAVIVILAMLSTLNAAVFTGARATFAWGVDNPRLGLLGRWDERRDSPAVALMVQAGIALTLVVAGTITRQGVSTMVDFTSPVFWLFLLLIGASLLWRRPAPTVAAFRVPLYPLTPLLFCMACGYMLYASLAYTGTGALFGLGVLAAGVPVMLWIRRSVAVTPA